MDDIKKLLIQLIEGQEEMKLRIDKLESKLETKIQSVDSGLKKLAEVQKEHFEQNVRNHEEIVEVLSSRIDNQERAIKKLNIVK